MLILISTLGFITLLWKIYIASSRIRAKYTNTHYVELLLSRFYLNASQKEKKIIQYNVNYIFNFLLHFLPFILQVPASVILLL